MSISSQTLHTDALQSLHFLHIPKTAGTSIRSWLMDLYTEKDWLPCHFLEELEQRSDQEIKKYHFFSGHLGINWYANLGHTPHTFTWLRNPLDREMSQYYYVKNTIDVILSLSLSPLEANYFNAVNNLSMSELYQSSAYIGFYDNLQVRFLAGIFPIKQQEPIYCNDDILNLAKENLLKLFFWGICELMEDSVVLFNYSLGIPPRQLNLSLNKRKKAAVDHQSSEEERKIIQKINYYDQQLYSFAKSVFQERFKNFTEEINLDFQTYPQKLRKNNQKIIEYLRSNFQEKQRSVSKLTQIDFDFSEAIFIENWYPRFYYHPINKWLRWAGPENTSYIYVPLAENNKYQISFTIFYTMSRDILESLSLWIGETKIELDVQENNKNERLITYQFKGIIGENLISSTTPYTPLKFVVPRTIPLEIPNHDGDVVETSYVSFATDGLTIQPCD
ncbi:sulfotransferase family 2 domain-containing protein [Crocosphaera sp. Alani8]|uniref:sulfotransferase family 2 domain-containing protein n=1 Tax=Crocosphaera sp. Alani8 TaxID=3038952 RepID=UPI00313D3707